MPFLCLYTSTALFLHCPSFKLLSKSLTITFESIDIITAAPENAIVPTSFVSIPFKVTIKPRSKPLEVPSKPLEVPLKPAFQYTECELNRFTVWRIRWTLARQPFSSMSSRTLGLLTYPYLCANQLASFSIKTFSLQYSTNCAIVYRDTPSCSMNITSSSC